MKKLILIFTVISVLLSACGRDDEGNTNPTGTTYVKMKVNGRSWQATSDVVAGLSIIDGNTNATIVGKTSFEGQQSALSVVFSSEDEITEGTYNLSDYDGGVTLSKIDGKTYLMLIMSPATSCVVNITGIQTTGGIRKIKGTFSGTLTGPSPEDVINITEGEFSGY